MEDRKIALTIILNHTTEEKKFLMEENQAKTEFIVTESQPERTGLATALEFIKHKIQLPVENLQLVELANVIQEETAIPFFVFSSNDEIAPLAPYQWEDPEVFMKSILKVEVQGAPFF